MLNIIKKIFGDKHEKDLKVLWPIVDEINTHYEAIKNLTDDELRNKTKEFKEKIQTHTEETRKQIEELKSKLKLAQEKLLQSGQIKRPFIKAEIAAISVGIMEHGLILDLDYLEDSRAIADFNFVLTRSGEVIEVQGTAEQQPIS